MAKFEPTVGQQVFLADGRKAVFAGVIDGQNFVRIMLYQDDEYGCEEWPSDKLTPVGGVYAHEPQEAYGPKIGEAKTALRELQDQAAKARADVLDLRKQANEIEQSISKYPDFSTAIDFMEGRITHVTIENVYSAPKIETFQDAMTQKSDHGRVEGMRLLCLFGTDERGRKCRWHINRYYDGSGGSTIIVPHNSYEAAEQYLRERWAEELELWRAGAKSQIHAFRDCRINLDWPEEYLADARTSHEKHTAEQVARLEAQIAAAKAGSAELGWASLAKEKFA